MMGITREQALALDAAPLIRCGEASSVPVNRQSLDPTTRSKITDFDRTGLLLFRLQIPEAQ